MVTAMLKYLQNNDLDKLHIVSTVKFFTDFHWNLFSQSHIDYDISSLCEDGVPHQHLDRYDENYLKNLFNEETLKKLQQVDFTNVTTYCTKKTLKNSIKALNATGVLLYISDNVLFDEPSDGLVALRSCRAILRKFVNNITFLFQHLNFLMDIMLFQVIK